MQVPTCPSSTRCLTGRITDVLATPEPQSGDFSTISPSSCATCQKSGSPSQSLQKCVKRHETTYRSRECQKGPLEGAQEGLCSTSIRQLWDNGRPRPSVGFFPLVSLTRFNRCYVLINRLCDYPLFDSEWAKGSLST